MTKDDRSSAASQPAAGLSPDELSAQESAVPPPREQMSLVTPGVVDGTPALEVLPDEAQG